MIGDVLYSLLTTSPGVTNICSTRILPNKNAQGVTLPCVTYFRVSSPTVRSNQKIAGVDHRIQIDCWSSSYDEANDLALAVFNRLDGYKGTVAGHNISHILRDDEQDRFVPKETGDDVGVKCASADYKIWASETIPTNT